MSSIAAVAGVSPKTVTRAAVAARSLPSRLALTLALALACVAAIAGPAQAAGCYAAYDAATDLLTIGNCGHDPDAPTIAEISRTAAGSILLDDQPIAGGPTVTNTDKIVYDGDDSESDELTLDMSNGEFRPGATPEIFGGSEIELAIDGGSGPTNRLTILGDGTQRDSIRIGAAGIDIGGDDDSDITTANVTGRLTVDGQGGRDYLRGAGWPGQAPSSVPLEVRG